MISKRISARRDGRSSARSAFRYGEGLASKNAEIIRVQDKSHRTRLGNFGMVDDGIYTGRNVVEMAELLDTAAMEMQANCDLNTRVATDKKIAHFVISYNQQKPSEEILLDTEHSFLVAMKLDKNHYASFLHNDNGYWHLHLFASRIDKQNHLGNPLWQDRKIRDRICRELEIKHQLSQDNGMHKIDDKGEIVELSREARISRRANPDRLGDKAITIEKYTGIQSFQTWVADVRLGDCLKQCKSWQEMHAVTAQYGCLIKPRGAGFVVAPLNQKGAVQLSKIGLKNLEDKIGKYEPRGADLVTPIIQPYKSTAVHKEGRVHFEKWLAAKSEYQQTKNQKISDLRAIHTGIRKDLFESGRHAIKKIRSEFHGESLRTAISVARMQQAVRMSALSEQLKIERLDLRVQLKMNGPGTTFKDYLAREGGKGDGVAIRLLRKMGAENSTDVARERHERMLQVSLSISGTEWNAIPLLQFKYKVGQSGDIEYDLGGNRKIIDSAVTRRIHLNVIAANDPKTVEIALRYAMLKFGNKLSLTGPIEFQRLVVDVAVRNGLRVSFTDPGLEEYRMQLLANQYQNCGQITKENYNASNHPIQQFEQIPPPQLRERLHNLPIGNMVLDSK